MNDAALFIVGVAVFTVTVMAVLWTGYLTFAKAAEADQAGSTPKSRNQNPGEPASPAHTGWGRPAGDREG